jgi:hypothetical protein
LSEKFIASVIKLGLKMVIVPNVNRPILVANYTHSAVQYPSISP